LKCSRKTMPSPTASSISIATPNVKQEVIDRFRTFARCHALIHPIALTCSPVEIIGEAPYVLLPDD
ncbi:MAG TPA: hypothetical protein VN809_06505, partial [Telmatospirillum sp.]|nr:hypothetical protein [Telmatospirillum sp.]